MKNIFLLNPAAGDGHSIKHIVPQIRAASQRTGIPYTLYESKYSGDIQELVSRCADTGKQYRFFACGGDGTLNEAARGAMYRDNIQLGCVPCGSGNDFVRNLGGKRRFTDLDAQFLGKSYPIDVISSSDGHIAVNIVNIGFDCNIADGASHMKKIPLVSGSLSYLLSLANEMRHPQYQRMTITADDKPTEIGLFLLCAIGNGSFCGGGFRALPNADINDGFLELSTVRTMKRRDIIPMLPLYYDGSYISHPLANKFVHTSKCKTVSIRTPEPVRVSFDGEIVRSNHIKLSIEHKALNFIIPHTF